MKIFFNFQNMNINYSRYKSTEGDESYSELFNNVINLKSKLQEIKKQYYDIVNTLITEYQKKPKFQINSLDDLNILQKKLNSIIIFYNNKNIFEENLQYFDDNNKKDYLFLIETIEKYGFIEGVSSIFDEKRLFFEEMGFQEVYKNKQQEQIAEQYKKELEKIMNPPITDNLSEDTQFVASMKYAGVTIPKKLL